MTQTILVVDDQLFVTHLLGHVLRGVGYIVYAAVDGQDALRVMAEHPPDLVICDLMMPQMDGFELLRRLRADPRWADLPVIVLTARGRDQDSRMARELGAQAYLTKPFRPRDVVQAVAHYLPPQ